MSGGSNARECARLAPRSPRWCGEELAGRTILLCAEQGLGDILQFIRFAHLVKARGGRVLVACPDSLIRLAARCPGVDLAVDWTKPLPDSDVHAQLLSLPAILGTSLDKLPAEVPYVTIDDQTIEAWRPVVARALGQPRRERGERPGISRAQLPSRYRLAGQPRQ